MKERYIKVLKVEPRSAPIVYTLKNELTALQDAVSIGADNRGLIEVIDLNDTACIICNEESKMIGLEPNRRFFGDILCGVFYVVGQNRRREFVSLSEEQIAQYFQIFANIDTFSEGEVEKTIFTQFIVI